MCELFPYAPNRTSRGSGAHGSSLLRCRRSTSLCRCGSQRLSDSQAAQKRAKSPQDGGCRQMAFVMDLTGYELEPLRDDGEFVLYRARQPGNPVPVLARVAGRAPRSITRLEHEYALAAVLDPSWAARPLALSRNQGSTTLLLEDNGSQPLDRTLDRPLELTRFLRLTINLAIALGEVHRHGLIHKDIK